MPRLALLVLLVGAAACGKVKNLSDSSDGGNPDDDDGGATTIDAGNPGDPLNGSWQWWIGDDAEAACDVTIGGGEYEVYCAGTPYEQVPGCMKTKSDTRIRGSWLTGFDGSFDQVERWEGDTCQDNGYEPDVNVVHEGTLVMEADQDESSSAGGFLPRAFGEWNWALWPATDAAARTECEVLFEPAESASTAHFVVECLQDPTTPVAGCTEIEALVIDGTIDATEMAAEAWSESRYEGDGCSPDYPDPVVEDEHTPMGAEQQ